tara:strand:+ start:251 stop:1021 length:771 start_codon:yes stop_codon:yes gene_type:complete
MDKELTPIFGRPGSKSRLRKIIYRLMPDDFKTFVEPFIGGGAVYLGYKFKDGQKAVINDIDKQLMGAWRLMKKGFKINESDWTSTDIPTLQRWADMSPKSDAQRFIKYLVQSRNTFGQMGRGKIATGTPLAPRLKKLPDMKEKLKNTTLLSEGVYSVINKYDKAGNFFYFDPPYEASVKEKQKIYKNEEFDFPKFAARLKKMKSKWMLSINDSKNIRELFKGFKMKGLTVKPKSNSSVEAGGIGTKARKELIIMNY